MLRKDNLAIGVSVCLLCWLIGFWFIFDIHSLHSSHERKVDFSHTAELFPDHFSEFIKILSNNLIVAFILSFLGYVTFGLVSLLASFYNGIIIAIHINNFLNQYKINLLHKTLLHAPTELLALLIFGAIGFSGFSNARNLFSKDKYIFTDRLPSKEYYYLPVSLLVISAFIESDLHVSFFNILGL